MAIRVKNIDWNTSGADVFFQHTTFLGDMTANGGYTCFIAPIKCVLKAVDVYSRQGTPPTNCASVTVVGLSVRLASATGTILAGPRGTSASTVTTDVLSADERYRLLCTGNNSLSVGAKIVLHLSAQGSGALSNAFVVCSYTPLIHETR